MGFEFTPQGAALLVAVLLLTAIGAWTVVRALVVAIARQFKRNRGSEHR